MTRQLGVKLPEADESDLTEPGDAGAAGSESAADGEAAGKAADTAAGDKNIVQSGTLPPASEQDRLAAALGGSPLLAMGLFLLAGILLAFTPCVFPMVPILSGLIAGEGDRMTGGRAFRLSLGYVLAMAVVYTLSGVVAGLFGHNLQAVFQHPVILVSFAALFVALLFSMFGFYELQLPSSIQTRLNELSSRAEGGTLMGAAIMGALSALVVGPCVAPALMGALIYIGQTGDAILGGLALFAMAMGMGIPLVTWGAVGGELLPRSGAWMEAVKAVFGVGLLALPYGCWSGFCRRLSACCCGARWPLAAASGWAHSQGFRLMLAAGASCGRAWVSCCCCSAPYSLSARCPAVTTGCAPCIILDRKSVV